MTVELLKQFLLWCLLFNYGVLLLWAGFWIFGREFIYRLHSRWFDIPRDRFDSIHYLSMAVFKILILVFHLVPLLALCLLG